MKTCKTCRLWGPMPGDQQMRLRPCACPAIRACEISEGRNDGLTVWPENEAPMIFTGPDFGCVHHAAQGVPEDAAVH